jgi:hypothetical protein
MLKVLGVLALAGTASVATLQVAPSAPTPAASAPICHTETKGDPDAPPEAAKALLTGYGSGGFTVKTTSPEAQAYFNNGMQLAHAFAHKAATSAFMRASQLDPTCAMCVWGVAWSRGPTINYDIEGKEQNELAAMADKAAVLAKDGPEGERRMIAALQLRYHDGGGKGGGDLRFARAMDELAKAHPADDEIAVIAADALMIPASLNNNRDNLGRARELLLGVLNRSPNDTGAIHFYIHATENDGVGTLALPYAEKLGALAPAASHLVHMPSHTFLWAGRFKLAEQSNIEAVKIDQANALRLKTKDGVFGLSYHVHNVQFGMGAALLDGDAEGALFLAADEVARMSEVKADDAYQQAVLGTAYFGYGRYGDLKTVEGLPDPGARLPFDAALRQYAIGEAAARAGDTGKLKAAIAAIGDSKALGHIKDRGLKRPFDVALVRNVAEAAKLVLVGRLAMIEHRYGDAEVAYRKAAEIEEAKLGDYRDPPFFWYPPRRSLAAAYLADGKRTEARREIDTVLVRWPYDPLSLRIVADIESANGRADEANRQRTYALSNWTGDIAAVPLGLI